MSEIKLNIPLEAYTDNVRIITTEPLKQHYGGGAWEVIEAPTTSVEDLENSLKILEEKNEGKIKLKIEKIKAEIKRREKLQKCEEKARWWYPFRSEKEGRDFVRRWNEVTRVIREEMQHE